MRSYDDSKLIEAIPELKPHLFPQYKHALYNYILDSLRGYHEAGSESRQAANLIREAELLREKELFGQGLKLLGRAGKLSEKSRDPIRELELIRCETRMLSAQSFSRKKDRSMSELYKRQIELLEEMKNLTEYHELFRQISSLHFRKGIGLGGKDKRKLKKILEDPLLRGPRRAKSNRALVIFYQCRSICYHLLGDYKKRYKAFHGLVKAIEAGPLETSSNFSVYINALQGLVISQGQLGKYAEIPATFRKTQALVHKLKPLIGKKVDASILIRAYFYELMFYQNIGLFREGIERLDEIQGIIDLAGGKVALDTVASYFYYASYLYFGEGDLHSSLRFVNRILSHSPDKIKRDIYGYARLMLLVLHYELGNHDLLESLARSALRYFRRSGVKYGLESLILHHLPKVYTEAMGPKDHAAIFQRLQEGMQRVLRSQPHQTVLNYFNFMNWVTSKIEEIPFTEVHLRKIGPELSREKFREEFRAAAVQVAEA